MNESRLKRVAKFAAWLFLTFAVILPLSYSLNLLLAIWHALTLHNNFNTGDLYDSICADIDYAKRNWAAIRRGEQP